MEMPCVAEDRCLDQTKAARTRRNVLGERRLNTHSGKICSVRVLKAFKSCRGITGDVHTTNSYYYCSDCSWLRKSSEWNQNPRSSAVALSISDVNRSKSSMLASLQIYRAKPSPLAASSVCNFTTLFYLRFALQPVKQFSYEQIGISLLSKPTCFVLFFYTTVPV